MLEFESVGQALSTGADTTTIIVGCFLMKHSEQIKKLQRQNRQIWQYLKKQQHTKQAPKKAV